MLQFSLYEMANILNAYIKGKECIIHSISINSKDISNKKQCLFIALKGKKFDGHIFIQEAIKFGVAAILVDRLLLNIKVTQLVVDDTFIAFQKISSWIRNKYNVNMIAITGSAGKTTVKEMTASILKQKGKVLYTEGNLNNEIGVSLTLCRLNNMYDYSIIEIGSNQFGEISRMSILVKPNIVLINNIYKGHLLGFDSLKGIYRAKSEIFDGLSKDGYVIINNENSKINSWKKKLNNINKILYFSLYKKNNVSVFAESIIYYKNSSCFKLCTPQGTCKIHLQLLGKHNVLNAIAASTLSIASGASLKDISEGLHKVKSIIGRSYYVLLKKDCVLIDDTYNANIGSMKAAIDMLQTMIGYKIIIVGDIMELGKEEILLHSYIGKCIKLSNVDIVLSIGYLSQYISFYSNKGKHFIDKYLLYEYVQKLINQHNKVNILVKGSRSSRMEEIVKYFKEFYL